MSAPAPLTEKEQQEIIEIRFGSHPPDRSCWADEIESFLDEAKDTLRSKGFTDLVIGEMSDSRIFDLYKKEQQQASAPTPQPTPASTAREVS